MNKVHISHSAFLGAGIVVGAVVFAVLHVVATVFYLYWFYWWLDTLMHFLGGIWVGMITLWFVRTSSIGLSARFSYILGVVFLVSVLWEVFEVAVGHTDPSIGAVYWLDTAADVTAGTVGGALVGLYAVAYRRGP